MRSRSLLNLAALALAALSACGGGEAPWGEARQALGRAIWQAVPGTQPPARQGHVMVGTPEGVLLFGGRLSDGTYAEDTWRFDGTGWTRLQQTGGPPVRSYAAAAYDSGSGLVVLAGGFANVADGHRRDTWTFDGASWARAAETGLDRRHHGMAFVDGTGVVAFGGMDSSNVVHDETLVWSGSAWSSMLLPARPPARHGTPLVYDASRGVARLFGGRLDGDLADPSVWALGAGWSDLGALGGPPQRKYHAAAYDPSRRVTVLVGGEQLSGTPRFPADTWELSDAFSRTVAEGASPAGRVLAGLAFEPGSASMILFGGAQAFEGALLEDGTYRYTWVETADGGTAGDAGSAADSGLHADAGVQPDAGAQPDAGVQPDAGTAQDGGGTAGGDGGPSGPSPPRYGCSSAGGALGALGLVFLGLLFAQRRALVVLILLGLPAGAWGQDRLPVAFLGLEVGEGVRPNVAATLTDVLQNEMEALGPYSVISMSEVETILGIEAKKKLAGCSDDDACLAAIGGALGARRMLTASLSRLGKTFILTVALLDGPAGRAIGRTGRRVRSADPEALLDEIRPALEAILARDDEAIRLLRSDAGGTRLAEEEASPGPSPAPEPLAIPPAPAGPRGNVSAPASAAAPSPEEDTSTRRATTAPPPEEHAAARRDPREEETTNRRVAAAPSPGEDAAARREVAASPPPRLGSPQPAAPSPPLGLWAGLRAEASPDPGGTAGLALGWEGGRLGFTGHLLFVPLGGRLQAHVLLPAVGPVTPFVGAGAALFPDSVHARLAAGLGIRQGSLRLGADLGYEYTLSGPYQPHSVLGGLTVGLGF